MSAPLLCAAALLLAACSVGADEAAAAATAAALRGSAMRGASRHTASHTAAGASSARIRAVLRRRGQGGAKDAPPACSCDCCNVVQRRPDEVSHGAGIKCAPAVGHSADVCADQCTPAEDDHVLVAVQDEAVDVQRFCFFECKPEEGILSAVSTQCVELNEQEAQKVVDSSGNAMDPAFLYSQGVGTQTSDQQSGDAALLASRTRLGQTEMGGSGDADAEAADDADVAAAPAPAPGAAPGPAPGPAPCDPGDPCSVSAADAIKAAKQGITRALKEASDAQGEAAQIRDDEAGVAEGLNQQLRSQYGPPPPAGVKRLSNKAAAQGADEGAVTAVFDPYAAVDDIKMARLATQAAAGDATQSAEAAVETYKAARAANWVAALTVAQQEVLKYKQVVADKVLKDSIVAPGVSWSVKAGGVAAKAMKPYIDSMHRAMDTARAYRSTAETSAGKANDLEAQAKAMEADAEAAGKAGRLQEATSKILSAQDLARQAQELSKQARGAFDTAKGIRGTLSKYAAAAQSAANAAVSAEMGGGTIPAHR